jgi:hypothetical protein
MPYLSRDATDDTYHRYLPDIGCSRSCRFTTFPSKSVGKLTKQPSAFSLNWQPGGSMHANQLVH